MLSIMSDNVARTSCLSTPLETLLFNNNNSKPTPLPSDFQPRDIDVMCGRGKGFWNHKGNKRFKKAIQFSLDRYAKASTKAGKSAVVSSLVETLRKTGTLFIKHDKKSKCWYDIGDRLAREKTSHAIRDHVSAGGVGISNNVIQQKQSQNNNVMSMCAKEQTELNVTTKVVQNNFIERNCEAMDSSTHTTTSNATETSNVTQSSYVKPPLASNVSSNDSILKQTSFLQPPTSNFAFEGFVHTQSTQKRSEMNCDILESLFCKANAYVKCSTDKLALDDLSGNRSDCLELSINTSTLEDFFCQSQSHYDTSATNSKFQPQHGPKDIEDEIIPWSELFPVDWDNC